jgi:hypothetical protein
MLTAVPSGAVSEIIIPFLNALKTNGCENEHSMYPAKIQPIHFSTRGLPVTSPLMAAALSCLAELLFGANSSAAKEQESLSVKHRLLSKQDKNSKDVSGIACKTDRDFLPSCLVIEDNLQGAQFVKVKDGELVARKPVNLIDAMFKGESLELEDEGVAFANGRCYTIGSDGTSPRQEA